MSGMAPNLDTVEQYAGCIDGRIKNYQKQHGRKISGKILEECGYLQ